MNIADTTTFEGAESVEDLVSRLGVFKMSMVDQLRKEPTVFFADPVAQPQLVEGAKAGDVAVWKDSLGADHFQVLGT